MSAEVWAALESLLDQGPEGAAQADELAVGLCGLELGGLPFWLRHRAGWVWRIEVLVVALKVDARPLFLGVSLSAELHLLIRRTCGRPTRSRRLITPAEAALLSPITPRIADAARLATRGYRPQPGDVLRAYLPSNHPLRNLES